MLCILTVSSLWTLRLPHDVKVASPEKENPELAFQTRACLKRFAWPQLALVALTIFNHHVQIITRMASGYALWYWCIALAITGSDTSKSPFPIQSRKIIQWMVLYAAIQGGLYASFLPPA